MIDQNVFMETLREVKEIVRTAPSPLTQEEMLAYFKDMELSDEQKNMIYAYLMAPPENVETDDNDADEDNLSENNQDEDVTLSESKVFRMYLDELNNIPNIDEDELSMLYIKLLRGDNKVIEKITTAWMKKVLKMSQKYTSNKYILEDVIQEGNMGLFIKLNELCGSNTAVSVEEELSIAVENSIKAYISDITGEDDNEQTVIGKANLINEAKRYLTAQNGSEPSIKELAEYTRMDENELTDVLEFIKKAESK